MSDKNPFRSEMPPSEHEPRLDVAVVQHLGRRREQQDAFLCEEASRNGQRELRIAVADGHGVHGRAVAQHACTIILDELSTGSRPRFYTAFDAAHHWITQHTAEARHLEQDPEKRELPQGGTTVTCATISGTTLKLAYVGNSEARCFDAHRNTFRVLTTPHEWGAHAAETERVAQHHVGLHEFEDKHKIHLPGNVPTDARGYLILGPYEFEITRSLGDEEMGEAIVHEPETSTQELGPQHTFLLIGTDGFWDATADINDELADILQSASTVKDAQADLDLVLRSMKPRDNATVVVVDLRKRPKP